MLAPERLEPKTLAAEIQALLQFRPRPLDLDFSGASTSTSLLAELVGERTPSEAAV